MKNVLLEEAFKNGLEAKLRVFSVSTGVRTSYLVYKGIDILAYYRIARKLVISLHGYNHPSVLQKVNSCLAYLYAENILPQIVAVKKQGPFIMLYASDAFVTSARAHHEVLIQSEPFSISSYIPKDEPFVIQNVELTFNSMAGVL